MKKTLKFGSYRLTTFLNLFFISSTVVILLFFMGWTYKSSSDLADKELKKQFRQSQKMAETVLEEQEVVLQNVLDKALDHKILISYLFADKKELLQNSDAVSAYMRLMDKADLLFIVRHDDGLVENLSYSIFDTDSIIKSFRQKFSFDEGLKLIDVDVENEKYLLLTGAAKVVSPSNGRVTATVYAAIILNDNFSIVNTIKEKTDSFAVCLFFDKKIISSTAKVDSKESKIAKETALRAKNTHIVKSNGFIASKNEIKLHGRKTGLYLITVKEDTIFSKLKSDFVSKMFYAINILMIMSIIYYIVIRRVVIYPLAKLLNFANNVAVLGKSEKFVPTKISEFDSVGKDLEIMLSRLHELNETLEQRVEEEIKKRTQKEKMLLHQSRLAAMGEMIENIAHQWRQPLNALTMLIQTFEVKMIKGGIDEDFVHKQVSEGVRIANSMSKTIDDFRNFFNPNKKKELFDIEKAVEDALALVNILYKRNGIQIKTDIEKNLKVFGYANEFSQVLLNLLNNAKDALVQREIQNAQVKIKAFKENGYMVLMVEDNAGGIDEKIIDRVFEPYFTTKFKSQGTGIGLYMSKTIIEENMGGELMVKNTDIGASFIIKLPMDK